MILRKISSKNVPLPTDPYIDKVRLLLNGAGTNGAQNNTFIDSSSNNHTVTRYGNVTQGSFTPYLDRYSITQELINNQVNFTSGVGTAFQFAGDFTIEGFIDFSTSSPDTSFYLCSNGSTYFAVNIDVAVGVFNIYLNSGGVTSAITSGIVVGERVHVAMVRIGSTITLYTNGVAKGTISNSGTLGYANPTLNRIGGGNPAFTAPATYSNFRIVNGTGIYTANFTPPTSNLTAVSGTSILLAQSGILVDRSGNNFLVTVTGSIAIVRESPFPPTSAYNSNVVGGSGYFDGTGDSLTLPSTAYISGTGDFTVGFLFYPTVASASAISSSPTSGALLVLMNADLTMSAYRAGVGVDATTTNKVILNAWNFVTYRRESGVLTIRINSVSGYSAANTVDYASGTLRIGTDGDGTSNPYTGFLSDFFTASSALAEYSSTTIPTAPISTTGKNCLLRFTNGGIIDSSAHAVLETVGNAQINSGKILLDGTGDFAITTTTLPGFDTNDFTVEVICTLASLTAGAFMFLSTRTSASYFTTLWGFGGDSTGKIFLFTNDYVVQSSAGAISTSTQYHIAVCRSGTSLKLFLNGTQVGSTATNSQVFAASKICLGANLDGSETMNVSIIGRVTDYARYTGTFTPPTSFPNN